MFYLEDLVLGYAGSRCFKFSLGTSYWWPVAPTLRLLMTSAFLVVSAALVIDAYIEGLT